ncbi:MAG: hypothetical protein D6788_04150 [Planctomycetota bacterium]|nr:MAG: hypothetical protein D6788_04150 [Planctomycetota bacterium]
MKNREDPAPSDHESYVSRGGEKLAAALARFRVDPTGWTCADLGSHVGGFVDCLLQHGAARVYAVDTCYGTLAWRLRKDERVVVRERTNALHVTLPEPVDLVTIDVGWTRQEKVLPRAAALLRNRPDDSRIEPMPRERPSDLLPSRGLEARAMPKTAGTPAADRKDEKDEEVSDNASSFVRPPCVITLIKPHYEADPEQLEHGVLPDSTVEEVTRGVLRTIERMGWTVADVMRSPLRGHGGNVEVFALLFPAR